jgi:putative PIN family toxin of toxin-antitoxin system
VSAFAFGGVPQKVLSRVMQTADLYMSPELLEEYREVPGELLIEAKVTRAQWQALVAGIASVVAEGKVAHPRKRISICRDPEDNMVLECCLAARAAVLVTGDKDLLDIPPQTLRDAGLRKMRVLSPRSYMAAVSWSAED